MARRTTLLASLTLALAAATAACGDDDGTGPGDVETVEMRTGNTFAPPTLTINAGTTVRWVNEDATAHNTTSATGLWASTNLQPDGTFQHAFSNTGTFAYSCTLHPGMNGTIIVNQ